MQCSCALPPLVSHIHIQTASSVLLCPPLNSSWTFQYIQLLLINLITFSIMSEFINGRKEGQGRFCQHLLEGTTYKGCHQRVLFSHWPVALPKQLTCKLAAAWAVLEETSRVWQELGYTMEEGYWSASKISSKLSSTSGRGSSALPTLFIEWTRSCWPHLETLSDSGRSTSKSLPLPIPHGDS